MYIYRGASSFDKDYIDNKTSFTCISRAGQLLQRRAGFSSGYVNYHSYFRIY